MIFVWHFLAVRGLVEKMRGITTNNQISNLPVFRLPEMYLIQAEAYAKQSTPDYGKAKEKTVGSSGKKKPGFG